MVRQRPSVLLLPANAARRRDHLKQHETPPAGPAERRPIQRRHFRRPNDRPRRTQASAPVLDTDHGLPVRDHHGAQCHECHGWARRQRRCEKRDDGARADRDDFCLWVCVFRWLDAEPGDVSGGVFEV